MISYQLDPSSQLLKSYIPPFSGTWKTLPAQLLPDDVLQDSLNVTLLEGNLRSRLGHLAYSPFRFSSPVIGSFMFVDTTNTKYPLCSTVDKLYQYSADWNDVTGVSLNGSVDIPIRMTSIQIGTLVYLLYTNGVDMLKYMPQAGTLQNITPHVTEGIPSTIPVLRDVCTSFSRIVGIQPPYTVTWCDVLNDEYLSFTNWPALNQVILADTEDSLVAIRPLSTLGLAVYKEGNIFVGFPQAGSQANAFRFEHRGEYEGPCNPNAIVNVNGTHIYMTPTGRVGLFDGSTQNWICDGLWPFMQDDLDTEYANRVSGVYNYRTSEIYFYYPKRGDNGLCNGMLTINTPYPTAGVTTYSYFLGHTELDVRNGLSVRLFNASTSPLVFGNITANNYTQAFILDKDTYTDNNSRFNCSLTSGLFRPSSESQIPQPVSDIYRPTLELYATRDDTRGIVNISSLTSSNLENNGSVSIEMEEINLANLYPNEYIGYNASGSFLGFKAEWLSTAKVEYKGLDVYGRKNT